MNVAVKTPGIGCPACSLVQVPLSTIHLVGCEKAAGAGHPPSQRAGARQTPTRSRAVRRKAVR